MSMQKDIQEAYYIKFLGLLLLFIQIGRYVDIILWKCDLANKKRQLADDQLDSLINGA